MKEFGQRVISTTISLTLLLLLIYYANTSLGSLFVLAALSLLSVWALQEYDALLHTKATSIIFFFSASISVVWINLNYAFLQGIFPSKLYFSLLLGLMPIYFVCLVAAAKPAKGFLLKTASSGFSLLYITAPLSLMLWILYSPEFSGRIWFLYLIFVTKISDVAGYLGGKLLGRVPLAPKISPRKTWEGSILGVFFSIVCSLLFAYLQQKYAWSNFSLSYTSALFLGAFLSCIGQIGDLFESLCKRDAGKKDSSKLPGFGGVLDLLDSLLFTTPFLTCFLLG